MIETRNQKPETRNRRSPKALLFWFLVSGFWFTVPAAVAQDRYKPTPPLPLGDILFSLPTSHIPTDGTFELKFTHRFNQSLDQGSLSDRVHLMWGLDSNADVAIGGSWTV